MLQEENGSSKLSLLIQRYLEVDSVEGLKKRLVEEYGQPKLVGLLKEGGIHTQRSAAYCLGLIGGQKSIVHLAEALKSEDTKVCINSEEALWSIWFRSGDEEVDKLLLDGVSLLQERKLDLAIEKFEAAMAKDPDFAEAYNQRAIANFMLGNWDQSIADCQTTIQLNPFHFGALAGMGHCYLKKGDLKNAIKSYEKAIEINPTMLGIVESIDKLREIAEMRG